MLKGVITALDLGLPACVVRLWRSEHSVYHQRSIENIIPEKICRYVNLKDNTESWFLQGNQP